jgi:hypothetical protein
MPSLPCAQLTPQAPVCPAARVTGALKEESLAINKSLLMLRQVGVNRDHEPSDSCSARAKQTVHCTLPQQGLTKTVALPCRSSSLFQTMRQPWLQQSSSSYSQAVT